MAGTCRGQAANLGRMPCWATHCMWVRGGPIVRPTASLSVTQGEGDKRAVATEASLRRALGKQRMGQVLMARVNLGEEIDDAGIADHEVCGRDLGVLGEPEQAAVARRHRDALEKEGDLLRTVPPFRLIEDPVGLEESVAESGETVTEREIGAAREIAVDPKGGAREIRVAWLAEPLVGPQQEERDPRSTVALPVPLVPRAPACELAPLPRSTCATGSTFSRPARRQGTCIYCTSARRLF